jgi:hypothetical protein
MKPSTDTLIERVDELIQPHKAPHVWGSPRLSATPTPLAVQQLAMEIAELEDAVREIALEVQRLSGQERRCERSGRRTADDSPSLRSVREKPPVGGLSRVVSDGCRQLV